MFLSVVPCGYIIGAVYVTCRLNRVYTACGLPIGVMGPTEETLSRLEAASSGNAEIGPDDDVRAFDI